VPDQNGILRGLLREDLFTVVFEQVMTDTARYADILLPATTFLEHYDFKRSYGSYVVGATKPVIEAEGEARSNASVFAELGRALGFEDGIFHWTEAELRERAVAAIELQGKPVSPEPFATGGIHRYDFDGSENPVQFEASFPRRRTERSISLPVSRPRPTPTKINRIVPSLSHHPATQSS
jgi:anaerobic selenocysteine-containing dehydrogenase